MVQRFLPSKLSREYHVFEATKGESAVFWRSYTCQLDSQQMLMQLLTGVAYQPDGMCIVCGTCRSATYISRQPTAHQYYQQAV